MNIAEVFHVNSTINKSTNPYTKIQIFNRYKKYKFERIAFMGDIIYLTTVALVSDTVVLTYPIRLYIDGNAEMFAFTYFTITPICTF